MRIDSEKKFLSVLSIIGFTALAISSLADSETNLCSCPQGTTNSLRIIHLCDDEKKSFSELWRLFKKDDPSRYKPSLLRMMLGRSNDEVDLETDRDICESFQASPTPDLALLLGMCSSEQSRALLSSASSSSTDASLSESLDLAREMRVAMNKGTDY